MPNRALHNLVATAFGLDPELVDAVNKDIDAPARWMGPSHRKVRHDAPYAVELGVRFGDPQAFAAAGIHYLLDQASQDPNLRRAFRVMEAVIS